MKDERIVFFDLETGGLDPLRHPIIQIALLAVDGAWQEVEALEMKISFDPAAADPEALKINGFNPETWKTEAQIPPAALAETSNFLGRHATMEKVSKRGRPYFVARLAGHNVERFDCGFLVQWFKEANLFCPAACYEPLDTLSLARWASFVAPTKPRDHKLESLCAWLGVDVAAIAAARRRELVAAGAPDSPDLGLHDALVDIRATVQVACSLAERLKLGWRCPRVAHAATFAEQGEEVRHG